MIKDSFLRSKKFRPKGLLVYRFTYWKHRYLGIFHCTCLYGLQVYRITMLWIMDMYLSLYTSLQDESFGLQDYRFTRLLVISYHCLWFRIQLVSRIIGLQEFWKLHVNINRKMIILIKKRDDSFGLQDYRFTRLLVISYHCLWFSIQLVSRITGLLKIPCQY